MNAGNLITLEQADKVFYTYHMFRRSPVTDRRMIFERRRVHAVDHIDLEVPPGEVFGLLGPNGAGKTTVVKMLSGLVRPSSGNIMVDGLDVVRKRSKVLRRVGVVLEGTRTCIWPLTPMENLSYFGNLKGVRGKILKVRSRELLEFIGLKEKMDVQVRRLSRGQKQKLAICIALIADPCVLLLDEPTTGLDVQSSRAIKDRIIEMARHQQKSILVTTHDMHVAQEICDRIGIINDGKLVACRNTEQLLDLFSDQTYELRLDRLPGHEVVETVPGVIQSEFRNGEEGALCIVRLDTDPDARSAALYELFHRLHQEGLQLQTVNQRQTTLENVFLALTDKTTQA